MGHTERLQFVAGEKSYPHLKNNASLTQQLDRHLLPPFLRPVPGRILTNIWYHPNDHQELQFTGGYCLNIYRRDALPTSSRRAQFLRDKPMFGARVERVEFTDRNQFDIHLVGGFVIRAETA